MFHFPSPSTLKGWVGRSDKKKKTQKIISNEYNSFKLKTFFYFHWNFKKYGSVMFSLNGTLKKQWVVRAMGNETIYWDGLNSKMKCCHLGKHLQETILGSLIQYNTVQYIAMQCNAVQWNTIQYNTTQVTQHNWRKATIQYNTTQYNSTSDKTQHNTKQYITIQHKWYNTTQLMQNNNTILYNTIDKIHHKSKRYITIQHDAI